MIKKHFPIALSIFLLTLVVVMNYLAQSPNVQHLWLASSFLRGELSLPTKLVDAYSLMDVTPYAGKYFWPLGPFPAVLFMPFVFFFGIQTSIQAYAQIIFVLIAFYAAWRLAKILLGNAQQAWWCALALCFGSVFVGIVFWNGPWPFEHVFVVSMYLLALAEQYGKRRPWLVGLFCAIALATRLTSGFGLLFFIAQEFFTNTALVVRLRRVFQLIFPATLVLFFLGWYNQARFGSFFTTGYAQSWLDDGWVKVSRARSGLFSLYWIPRNAYYYFLRLPQFVGNLPTADPKGLSFFVISPLFALLFFIKNRTREWWLAIGISAVELAIFLCYYTTGYWQFGPRLMTDFLPFLYLALLFYFQQHGFNTKHTYVITFSVIFNTILFFIFLFFAS